MATTNTQAKPTITDAIFPAFKSWINQDKGLDKRDYYADVSDRNGVRAYWDDWRSIRKDQARARKALCKAQEFPFNAEAMRDALERAFSGRLSWNGTELDYVTGQYFPTEFAIAAAVVLERYFETVRPKFVPGPEQRSQWWTIEEIERANYNAGFHWFDASTKRFFRSRVLATVYQGPGGIFFVSSEKGPSEKRLFSVREFKPETADVDTFGPFNEMSRERAQRLARIASQERKAAEEAIAV